MRDATAGPLTRGDQPSPRAGARPGRPGSPWERFGWLMAVIWMVFLFYPVVALVDSDAAVGWRVTGWVALVAFAVLYVAGFVFGLSHAGGGLVRPPHPLQWVCFGLLIACAAVSIPAVYGSALSYLPFIMAFASYGLNRPAHWVTTVVAIVVTAAVVLTAPDPSDFVAILAIVVLLGIVNTVSTSLIIRSEQTERLGRELAVSAGREAVARDVHDLVGHSLTVVRLKAQLARRFVDADPERAKAELAAIEQLTAEAIGDVRRTVAGARASTLTDQLSACHDVLATAGVTLRCEGSVDALSPVQALTASWILREATTNVLRHAAAATVTVCVGPGRFGVSDDGVGADAPEGNGIRGMRERAAASGAGFAVASRPGEGTRVEVTW